jgi:redox-sensitive bicupin YhaK (pirin superfamily)
MEIITIVVEGSLQHQDSLGHGEILRPDEVQVMTAGRGIRHSEFNPSHTSAAHFIQIWIEPETMGLEPAYAQKAFSPELRRNNLLRVAGGKQLNDQALHINQDAHVYVTTLAKDATVSFKNVQGRACWIHLIQGECLVNERVLKTGDAASTEGPEIITIQGASTQADIILFDLC